MLFFVRLGCNIAFNPGNSINQGTCPNSNQVCNSDGSCSGTCFAVTISNIIIMITLRKFNGFSPYASFYFTDKCAYGKYDKFNITWYHSLSYPIDVFWMRGGLEEVVAKSNLAPGKEIRTSASFTHEFIFKRAGTENRLFANANGVRKETYEGCDFGAQVNSLNRVEIIETGGFFFARK